MKPRIVVLGCGRIGRMHADNIAAHSKTELAGVFDIDPRSAASVAKRHNVTEFSSTAEAIESPAVDAVLIAAPTSTHVELLEASVNAGKPVLCEKPIDLSLERVNRLKKRIAGSNVPVMLGFVRRFDPGHAAARKAAACGEIGEIHQVIITSRDPGMAPDGYIETSGGIYRDMTIHDLDLARFILDEDIATVSASGSRLVDPQLMVRCNDFDTVTVTLVSESGRQAMITNSRKAIYGYDQRVEIFGSQGMVISGNRRENELTRYGAETTGAAAKLQHFFIERYREAFLAEIDHFAAVVAGQASVPVGFEDGQIALLLADACGLSVAEGRTVRTDELT
ncbi:MAG: inositol 2-dehydrogenase [Rhodobacteraceae bacterium]|nr:inositol 2-dehydrogenase [Paracoccaceae bacterium]MCY4328266.1 inositol 2-dehydrogenase [Paracoccaceae bacterium]